jgi:hypothetical protein
MIALAFAFAGCTSPESTRMRAGGQGADVGNRGQVQLHANADPYYQTPTRGPGLLPRPKGGDIAASPKGK